MRNYFLKKIVIIVLLFSSNTTSIFSQWNLTGNSNATSTSVLGTINSVPLNLITNNLNRMTISANGRIGIGVNNPVNILSVQGSGGIPAPSWVNSGAPLFTGFGEQTIGNADYVLSMASTLFNARPVFIGRRAKGSLTTPTAVANNDYLMSFLSSGYDGNSFQNPAGIDFYVDGVPLLGSVPARISFVTGSNSGNRAERLKIGSTGNFTFNNSQLFIDNGSGNIGIGTTSPVQKLYVSGNAAATGSVFIDANAVNNGTLSVGGSLKFGEIATGEGIISKRTAGGNQYGLDLFTGGNSRLTITNSGNIGIGTVTPSAKLEINGQIKITGGVLPPVAGSVLTSDATGLASWQLPSSGNSQWVVSANNISNTNSGNVGIGNVAPSRAKLEVNGVAGSGSTSAIFGGDGTGISIQRNWPTIGFNQYRDAASGYGKAIGNGYAALTFLDPTVGSYALEMMDSVSANQSFVSAPVRAMTIFKNGFMHVGANNVSNMATLSISGSSSYPSHFNFGAEGNTYIRGGNKIFGGPGVYANRRPSKVYINDQPGEQFGTAAYKPGGDVILATGGGNVAIGIDNPDYKTVIYSSTVESNNNTNVLKLQGRNPLMAFTNENNVSYGYIKAWTNAPYAPFTNGLVIGSSPGSPIFFSTNNYTATMTVADNGNVGIGTTTPVYKFDVCGNIRGKEVRVETGWCDYVFGDDYKLRSLKDVEDFIKTNKHLPDVTPGNEIETNGLEVGKTSAQMIRKIEELTLYVIEQEKAINNLKAHNERLEAAINLLIEKGGK